MSTKTEPIVKPKKGFVKSHSAAMKRHNGTVGFTSTATSETLLHTLTGVPSGDRPTMLVNIRQGLPFEVIVALEQAYGAPRKEIAEVLSIPVSTLSRRQKSGRLHADESDRVARMARLKDAALEMMQGNDEATIQWLHTPLEILGNETPMIHACTEMGARDVEDLVGRIRQGVFS